MSEKDFITELLTEFNLESIIVTDNTPDTPFVTLFVEGHDVSGLINIDKQQLAEFVGVNIFEVILRNLWIKEEFSRQLAAL